MKLKVLGRFLKTTNYLKKNTRGFMKEKTVKFCFCIFKTFQLHLIKKHIFSKIKFIFFKRYKFATKYKINL